MKKNNQTFQNNILKDFIIPLLLLGLWFVLTLFYIVNFDTSFSIWSSSLSSGNIRNINYDFFYRGETFKGQFTAQDNNLGIVAVRFQTYVRPPYQYEDQIRFRLREKGQKTWYYENTYQSGLIYDVPFFPFGFPLIQDSKGKIYEFEITSLNANTIDKISLSKRYPILQTKYKYSKQELLSSKKTLVVFLITKFVNALRIPDVVFSSFIYLLPFIIYYLVPSSFLGEYLKKIKKYHSQIRSYPLGTYISIDNFLFLIILLDIFIFQLRNDIVYLVILFVWTFSTIFFGYASKRSFIFALILITLCSFLLFLGLEPTAEKSAIWAFIILVSGEYQLLRGIRLDSKRK